MSAQPPHSFSESDVTIEMQGPEFKPDVEHQCVDSGTPQHPSLPHSPHVSTKEKLSAVATGSLIADGKDKVIASDAPAVDQPASPAPAPADIVEKASFGELYHFATGFDKLCVVISCIMMAGTGVTMTMSMIILGNVLDGLNDPSQLLSATRTAALNFLIIGLVSGFASAIGNGLPILAAERQMKRAREAYFSAVLRQDSAWFDTVKSGEMASNLAENSITWKTGIAEKFPQIFQGLATLCAGLGLGFHYSWQLTLLVLSIGPAVAIIGGIIAFSSGSLEKQATDALGEAGACATEILNSIRIVVAYGGHRQETQRYSNLVEKVKHAYTRKGWWVAAGLGAFFLCMFSAYAYSMYVGGILIRKDRVKAYCLPPSGPADDCLTGGRVVQTFFVVITALFSFGQTVPGIVALASAQVAAAKMLKVIRRVPAIDSSSPDGVKTPIEGRIEFCNVSFAYPSRPDVPILSNFNLVIEKGKSVAFVGPSGSGKSTIVALVLRMYDVQSGCILVDGKDIKEYNVVHLRSALGLVSQDPQLFSLSVSQNIALGKQDQRASEEEIIAAARAANADGFVRALPDGYKTIVGTSVTSSQLSGGQRQRVCIARCLIRKPSVMLFDEATSALDTESEVAVQKSIDSLLSSSARPTSLIIAHRLSTIVNADVICVINHGRIVQCGAHAELMRNQQGLYHHLQTLQQLNMSSTAIESQVVSQDSDSASNDTPSESISRTTVPIGNTPAASHASVPESRVWAMQKTELNSIIAALVFSLINGGANTVIYIHFVLSAVFPDLILHSGCWAYSSQSHSLFLHGRCRHGIRAFEHSWLFHGCGCGSFSSEYFGKGTVHSCW
jgi:ABC-type multidrug transport system fused ATPase/permease subunit